MAIPVSGIYKMQSLICPDDFYIGSAKNIAKRIDQHFNSLKRGDHFNNILQNHYNKYGKNSFAVSVIAVCDKNELTPKDNVVWLEQSFIWAYKPTMNICPTAGSCAGRKHKEETKEKIRRGMLGKKNGTGGHGSPKLTEILVNRNKSPEMRKIVSESKTGTHHSEETKQLLRDKMLGKEPPNKGKKGMQGKNITTFSAGHIPWNKGLKNKTITINSIEK